MIRMRFKLEDAARHCNTEVTLILRFVELKWIRPADSQNLFFDEEDIARIHLIQDLQNSMGVNEESVPVILHLIDQIHLLHRQLREKN